MKLKKIFRSVLIPANTFSTEGVFTIEYRAVGNTPWTNNSSTVLNIYINTTPVIGGNLIWGKTQSSSFFYYHTQRHIVSSGGITEVINSTTAHLDDAHPTNGASEYAIDWTVDQYVILTGSTIAGNTLKNSFYEIVKHNYS